jgi:hypothetical protein
MPNFVVGKVAPEMRTTSCNEHEQHKTNTNLLVY